MSGGPGAESYLVIDTNIWVYRTQLLTIPLGAALLYAVRRTNAKLGLPEIVEQELRKHTLVVWRDAIEKINQGYRSVETLMGKRDDYSVPSDHEVSKRIDERLFELEGLIYRIPFKFEHAKRALARVMNETPPNGPKNQQFKDSAIWEALLELSNERPVHFITQDSSFFKDPKKPKDCLADNLQNESGGRIKIYYDVSLYLNQIKEDIPELDRNRVKVKINEAISSIVRKHAESAEYEVRDIESANLSLYLTQKHNILAVEFQFNYRLFNIAEISEDHPENVLLTVKAATSYNLDTEELGHVSFEGISAKTKDGDNVRGMGAIYLSTGVGVVGRREIPYTFREPIS